jgi:hypothetical protein
VPVLDGCDDGSDSVRISDSGRVGAGGGSGACDAFGSGMQQPPGDGADLVEEPESPLRSPSFDRPGSDQQPKVGVDLLGGAVGDAPSLKAIPTEPAVALGEVCRHRARGANHLISNGPERRRNAHHDRDGNPGSLEGLAVGDQAGGR